MTERARPMGRADMWSEQGLMVVVYLSLWFVAIH